SLFRVGTLKGCVLPTQTLPTTPHTNHPSHTRYPRLDVHRPSERQTPAHGGPARTRRLPCREPAGPGRYGHRLPGRGPLRAQCRHQTHPPPPGGRRGLSPPIRPRGGGRPPGRPLLHRGRDRRRTGGEPLYIASEYIAGPNLFRAVREGGPMSGGTLDSLAMGVAAALTAIHGSGVIHRDLKPANVLLSPVGPKVIDFGIARALDDASGAITHSSQL